MDIPPVVVTQIIRRVTPKDDPASLEVSITRPDAQATVSMRRTILTLTERHAAQQVLEEIDSVDLAGTFESLDLYSAAVRLSEAYRVDLWRIYDEIIRLYAAEGEVPLAHIELIGEQIEKQVSRYDITEEKVDVALARSSSRPVLTRRSMQTVPRFTPQRSST